MRRAMGGGVRGRESGANKSELIDLTAGDRRLARGLALGGALLLRLPHARVLAAQGEELGVRAALDDPPAVEHEDLVGIDDGREAMRDDERRAAGGHATECALQQ